MNLPFKNKDHADVIALALCLFVFSFWGFLLTYKFFHFGYYDWDLAFFAQGMWNLIHGSGYVSLFGTNFFSNHANLIAYLIIPLYKVFPHPLTLVFLKIISYVIAGFVLYVLAKEKLGPTTAILFLCLYLIYIPNVLGIVYEFDFESLAPAFLMLVFYFYVKERWLGFLICAMILILIKENLPLIILAFSIHGLFTKKDKIRWALIPGVLAAASFYVLLFVFIPHISGRPVGDGHFYYIGHNYKNLGGSIGGVLSSIILDPVKIWRYIIAPVNLSFLVAIFSPFMYLPLGAPGILFLVSPIFVQHLLSAADTEHNIRFAYVLTIAPFLFLATVDVLGFIYRKVKKQYYGILILFLFLNIFYYFSNFLAINKQYMLKDISNQAREMLRDQWELVGDIPPDASVVASFPFLAPLSQRKDLYAFYKIYDIKYQNSHKSYQLPANVQYALIDTQDPWLLGEDDYESAKKRAQKFLTSGAWVIEKRYGRYILYRKKVM